MLTIGPTGLLAKHRKLMPTQHERLFHGVGAGDDLAVTETPVGRIGGLICWENRMPLARWRVYQGGPQLWVAPTADDSDGWLASMRHIAIESGAYVISVPQYIPAAAFPDDFPVPLPEDREVFGRGGAAVCEPSAGRDRRGAALRPGGDRLRRLRPAARLPREAVVRRRRALRPDGRPGRGGGRDALLGLTQYYTATTLDGFIADEQDSLDWLFTRARDEDGPLAYERFYEGVGAVAMGSTTYEWILDHSSEWPYANVPSWVFSSREQRPVEGADIRFVRGDVAPVHAEMTAAAGEAERLDRGRRPARRAVRRGAGCSTRCS